MCIQKKMTLKCEEISELEREVSQLHCQVSQLQNENATLRSQLHWANLKQRKDNHPVQSSTTTIAADE